MKQMESIIPFSSPEAAILSVGTENNDLWPGPKYALSLLGYTTKIKSTLYRLLLKIISFST